MSSNNEAIVCIIGHVCKDLNETPSLVYNAPGGGCYFGAIGLANALTYFPDAPKNWVQENFFVLTKLPVEDQNLFIPIFEGAGIKKNDPHFVLLESKSGVTCCNNIYNADGTRDQKFISVAESFNEEELSQWFQEILNEKKPKKDQPIIVYLTPLTKFEFPHKSIPFLKKFFTDKGYTNVWTVADIQGFLRKIDPNTKRVEKIDWEEKKAYLKHVDILKVDDQESSMLTGGKPEDFEKNCEVLIDWGCNYILCTRYEGVMIMTKEKKKFFSEFGEWKMEGRTGRGDTCTGTLVSSHFVCKHDLQLTADNITKVVTKKMNYTGPLRPNKPEN